MKTKKKHIKDIVIYNFRDFFEKVKSDCYKHQDKVKLIEGSVYKYFKLRKNILEIIKKLVELELIKEKTEYKSFKNDRISKKELNKK